MLHLLFRILSRSQRSTQRPQILLHAHVEPAARNGWRTTDFPAPIPALQPAGVTHRQRLLSMRLEHTKLCSPSRSERLKSLGVLSAGDLSVADLDRLAQHFGAPKKALRVLKQYRRAIRFAAAVPGMMPRDAMLLISIHRRSVRGLARESAAALHRDLERFAQSSQGQLQLRGRRIPSTRRLKQWITACEHGIPRRAPQARAA